METSSDMLARLATDPGHRTLGENSGRPKDNRARGPRGRCRALPLREPAHIAVPPPLAPRKALFLHEMTADELFSGDTLGLVAVPAAGRRAR
jgi:hypothetical protein